MAVGRAASSRRSKKNFSVSVLRNQSHAISQQTSLEIEPRRGPWVLLACTCSSEVARGRLLTLSACQSAGAGAAEPMPGDLAPAAVSPEGAGIVQPRRAVR